MAIEPIQTTFVLEPAVAFAGMIADSSIRDCTTELLETAAGIAPGTGVCQGTAAGRCKAPTAAVDVSTHFMGFAVHPGIIEPRLANANIIQQKSAVAVMRRGRIWVPVAVTIADDVNFFVVHSGADAGKIQPAAGAGPDATAVPNGAGRVIKGGAAGSIALVMINLP